MRTVTPLAGLAMAGPTGARPRWRSLLDWPERELIDAVVRLAENLRAPGADAYRELADAVGLPLGEVLASPFALRATAMAAARGVTTLQHECRLMTRWPADWQPDDSITDDEHGVWRRGALEVGKYQSFLQDDPLAVYNPAHMSKWGPHELTHRVAGFFWRPDLTPWELYLGARLNELLPVVLWYGPDEVARLDRDGFDRERDTRSPEARVEDAVWLTERSDALRDHIERTIGALTGGLAHFERELAAIDAEIEGGRCVTVAHPVLNASSDATAYVVGHIARLTSAATRQLIEGLLEPGRDYQASVAAYRATLEALFEELLFADLAWDRDVSAARRDGRRLWDWLSRAAQGPAAVRAALRPLLPDARAALAASHQGVGPSLEDWRARLREQLNDDACLLAGGRGDDGERVLGQLREGLASVAPATVALLEGTGRLTGVVETLVASEHFWSRTPLAERLEQVLRELGTAESVVDLLRFEQALMDATGRDDQVERLSPRPERQLPGFERGRLLASRAFRIVEFATDPVVLHTAVDSADGPIELSAASPTAYLIGAYFEGISVLPAPRPLIALWNRLVDQPLPVAEVEAALRPLEDHGTRQSGWPQTAAEWIDELRLAGVVGWVPDLGPAAAG